MHETFDHTADLGLRVQAETLNAVFVEAGLALFSAILENPQSVMAVQSREFNIRGSDHEYLLFDWLSELLYCFEGEKLVFSEFTCELTKEGLQATARGEVYDPARHLPNHEVKAITLHGLRLEAQASGYWLAEVVVDI